MKKQKKDKPRLTLKTTELISPKTVFGLTLVLATKPFLIIGIDLKDRSLIIMIFNSRSYILTVIILGRVFHL